MLEELLRHLKNWFVRDVRYDVFTIEGGALALPFVVDGQYYRIEGSVFNNGLHKMGEADLEDETFDGTVFALAIPKKVIELAEEIEEWQAKNGAPAPYQSESFGGYSYSRATDANGKAMTWQSAFSGRLNPWRKI